MSTNQSLVSHGETVRSIAARVEKAKLSLPRLRTHQRLAGSRRSIHRGEGDDFDGHDIYTSQDDPRHIDWNATALTGGQQVLVSLYRDEAHIRSVILLDVSRTMDFGTVRATKRIAAAELGACAVSSLARTHDPVSFIAYSRKGTECRIPSSSPASMILPVISKSLSTTEKNSGAENGKANRGGLAASLAGLPRSPQIIFLISDFLGTTDEDWQALRRVGRKHRIFSFMIFDPRERELPRPGRFLPTLYSIADVYGKESLIWLTRSACEAHQKRFDAHHELVEHKMKEARADFISVSTAEGSSGIQRALRFLENAS